MIIILNSLSGKLFISTSFSSSGVCPALLFGNYSSVFSFCLILCVCIYMLGRSVMFLSLGEMVIRRRHPMDSSSTLPSFHWRYMLKWCPLCRLSGTFCCGWADYYVSVGMQGWPLDQLVARSCFMWLYWSVDR